MKTKKKPHALFRLMRHSRQHRGQLMLASFFSVINKIVDLAPPILIGAAVDVVVAGEDSFIARFGIEDVRTQLIALAVISIIIWGFESLFQYLYNVLWRNLAQTIQHEFRLTTYTHVQKLEMAYFEDRSTGGLLAVLNDDVNQLERFLDGGANDLIQVTTTVIVIGGIFAFTVPTVAWMALLPMPLVILGTFYFQRKIAPRYLAVREQNSVLNAHLANNISGIATIKSFTSEGFEVEHIRTESDLYRQKNKSAIQLSSAFVPMIRMVIVIGFTAIMVFGGQLAFEGVLNIGAYSVLVFMTQRLLWPLTRLGTMLDLYQRAMASTTRILDLVDTEAKITDGEENRPVEEVRGEITFKDVCFKYDFNQTNGSTEAPITVNDLSLDIPAGETVAIVGPTGSGKSTLVKLLLRLYDVKEGSITLDSVDIRDLRLPDLRGAIGFVSQDVFLFHGTVCENIRYGSFGASMDEVIAAAKIAEAHEFIMEELPHGYDTIVGERGQKLSGGQRQRISIARAILKDPPVLILDEATSSVDNETEAAIQRSLEKIVVGRTTIVIAHRLSTVRNADRIYVLERGAPLS
jgi:ATP-binding cassette subfamily B protein